MDMYDSFRKENTFVEVNYDYDGSMVLAEEFEDNHPGIVMFDHAWTPNVFGSGEVLREWEEWEETLSDYATAIDDAWSVYDTASEETITEVARRIVDPESMADALEELTNTANHLQDMLSDLEVHLERNKWLCFRYSPYVDTNGFTIVVDREVFREGVGLVDSAEDKDIENLAVAIASYANVLSRGGVFHVTTYRAEWDEVLEEWYPGAQLDSLGGMTFKDEIPTSDEIWEHVEVSMST